MGTLYSHTDSELRQVVKDCNSFISWSEKIKSDTKTVTKWDGAREQRIRGILDEALKEQELRKNKTS